jgi:cell wall-associated NlpC family hydrolase
MRIFAFLLSCFLFGNVHSTNISSFDASGEHYVVEMNGAIQEVTARAIDLLGIKYRYGGTSPQHGFDCSGLVQYVFRGMASQDLPRRSSDISQVGQKLDVDELQPGDLVFFNTRRRAFSHIGIYLGDNKFIHAPKTGAKVRVEDMNVAYWKKRFNGARRILSPEQQNQNQLADSQDRVAMHLF